jgi:hypothetical protein
MRILGQFRDVDRPDRFVWLRSFPDMILRKHALETFYGGPTWKAHRAAANATMLDVDDVLLLRPVTPSSGFAALPPRPGLRDPVPGTTLTATVCSLDEPADVEALEQDLLPASPRSPRRLWRHSSRSRTRTPSRIYRCEPVSMLSFGSSVPAAVHRTHGSRPRLNSPSSSSPVWLRRRYRYAWSRHLDRGSGSNVRRGVRTRDVALSGTP